MRHTLQAEMQSLVAEEKLKTAEFSLTQCTVRAPANGFVTNWQIREERSWCLLPQRPLELLLTLRSYQWSRRSSSKCSRTFIQPRSRDGFQEPSRQIIPRQSRCHSRGTAKSRRFERNAAFGFEHCSAGVLAVKVVLNEDEDTDKLDLGTADRSPSTLKRFPRSIS